MLLIVVVVIASCVQTATIKKIKARKARSVMKNTVGRQPQTNIVKASITALSKKILMKGSPHRTAMLTVHGTHVHIGYSSPGVKGRIVWGGLVSYDKVWVTGAHQATRVRFYNDVIVNTDTISKGTYALSLLSRVKPNGQSFSIKIMTNISLMNMIKKKMY